MVKRIRLNRVEFAGLIELGVELKPVLMIEYGDRARAYRQYWN